MGRSSTQEAPPTPGWGGRGRAENREGKKSISRQACRKVENSETSALLLKV